MNPNDRERRLFLPPWLLYAIVAAVCWGIWGVLAKAPSRELSGWMTQVLFGFGLIPSAFLVGRSRRLGLGAHRWRGMCWGFLSGLIAGGGDLCFCLALQSGADTAIASSLICLFPLITILIAFFWFKERFNRVQAVGMILAIGAILLLSGGGSGSAPGGGSAKGLAPWIGYALTALACAGLFGIVQKLSTNHISAELSYLCWCGAFLTIALGIVATRPLNWHLPAGIMAVALFAGALNGFGVIASFAAYRSDGKAAIVAPLTATVQPAVTVLGALLFLGEQVGSRAGCGIGLALCAAAALARETPPPPSAAPPPS